MAALFATVIAGVPARIFEPVTAAIRERYPNQIVVRGKGAKLHGSRYATYSAGEIAQIISCAGDSVFGYSDRPMGFCRNPHRDCAEKIKSRKDCGNSDGVRACGRQKPNYFILAYQEALQSDEQRLVDTFYFSAGLIRIPRFSYDRREQTIESIVGGIKRMLNALSAIEQNFGCGAPCCLLPPWNFGGVELRAMLRKASRAECGKSDYGKFRQQYYRNPYFEGRAKLGFEAATDHGTTDASVRADIALPHHYRLGCRFGDHFHWDVSPLNGQHFNGKIPIYCRQSGVVHPTSKHVNILVDDCIRGAK